jgi:hypothetical protein
LSILPDDAPEAARRGFAGFGEGREVFAEGPLAAAPLVRRTGRFFVTVFAI